MWDWLKPGGSIFWYDFMYNNPKNQDVRGIKESEVASLFPSAKIEKRKITLAPPISRKACKISPKLYPVLNQLKFLRTHLYCRITKNA